LLVRRSKDQLDNVRGNYYGKRHTSRMLMGQFNVESAGKIALNLIIIFARQPGPTASFRDGFRWRQGSDELPEATRSRIFAAHLRFSRLPTWLTPSRLFGGFAVQESPAC